MVLWFYGYMVIELVCADSQLFIENIVLTFHQNVVNMAIWLYGFMVCCIMPAFATSIYSPFRISLSFSAVLLSLLCCRLL